MSLPLNIDDLIHQRKVESARIEYKKDWNPEKVPDPQFYNPETRSFMTVILPIHEAFKADELPVEAEAVVKSVEKTGMKTGMKTADAIIGLIMENPSISHDALAEQLGRARSSIIEQIAKLKSLGRLRRIGPDKGGHWEIVK